MPAGIVFKRQADPLPKTNTEDGNTCIPLDSSLCVEHWLSQPVAEQFELVEAGLCKRLEEVTSGCIIVAFLAKMPRQEHSYARASV